MFSSAKCIKSQRIPFMVHLSYFLGTYVNKYRPRDVRHKYLRQLPLDIEMDKFNKPQPGFRGGEVLPPGTDSTVPGAKARGAVEHAVHIYQNKRFHSAVHVLVSTSFFLSSIMGIFVKNHWFWTSKYLCIFDAHRRKQHFCR